MQEWIPLKGKLIEKVITEKSFKKTHKNRSIIIEFKQSQLDLYYHALIKSKVGPWINLFRPLLGLHVTVVSGNEDTQKDIPQNLINSIIEIEYNPTQIHRTAVFSNVIQNKKQYFGFWVIPIKSKFVEDLRADIKPVHRYNKNFPYQPHITIAREDSVLAIPETLYQESEFQITDEFLDALIRVIPKIGGNQHLEFAINDFKSYYKIFNYDLKFFRQLVYKHLSYPSKDWELSLIKLIGNKYV